MDIRACFISKSERAVVMFVDFFNPGQGEDSLSVRLLGVFHLCADATYRVHHPGYAAGSGVLVVTLAGEGLVRLGEAVLRLEAGDCLLMSPRGFFDYRCPGEGWEFWWFEFSADAFDFGSAAADPEAGGWRRWNVRPLPPLPDLFAEALTRLKQGEAGTASSLFAAALSLLRQESAPSREADPDADRFRRADRYIRANLETVTAASLADAFTLHERTLRNLFVRHTGRPPSDYIRELRMETARYLLRTTTKTVGDIALSLGYSSQFHFSKAFKQRQGLSPLHYRRRQRDGGN